MIFKLQPK